MTIYFLRHASAGKKHANSQKDERRPLDDEGSLQSRYIGRMLANIDVQPDQIISSPLKRALQTASIVANELAFEAPIRTEDALRPDAGFEQFQDMLARYRKTTVLIVVGHNPSITEFLVKTISDRTGATQVELKKGSVAKVELRGRAGVLQWLVTPKIARLLQATLNVNSRPKTSRK